MLKFRISGSRYKGISIFLLFFYIPVIVSNNFNFIRPGFEELDNSFETFSGGGEGEENRRSRKKVRQENRFF